MKISATSVYAATLSGHTRSPSWLSGRSVCVEWSRMCGRFVIPLICLRQMNAGHCTFDYSMKLMYARCHWRPLEAPAAGPIVPKRVTNCLRWLAKQKWLPKISALYRGERHCHFLRLCSILCFCSSRYVCVTKKKKNTTKAARLTKRRLWGAIFIALLLNTMNSEQTAVRILVPNSPKLLIRKSCLPLADDLR